MGSFDIDLGRVLRLACSAGALWLAGCSSSARRVPPSRGLQAAPAVAVPVAAALEGRTSERSAGAGLSNPVTSDRATTDGVTSDGVTSDWVTSDWVTSDWVTSDWATIDKATSDRASTDRAASDAPSPAVPGAAAPLAPVGVPSVAREVAEPPATEPHASLQRTAQALPSEPIPAEPVPSEMVPSEPMATDEPGLRRELATAADPTEAAMALVALLGEGERFDEALQVVVTAQARCADPTLRVLRASLHRDLGQRHLAVAELRELRNQAGPEALAPALLLELAELEWLEGDREAAIGTLQLVHSARGDERTAAVRAAAERLSAEIAQSPRPRTMRARDLLGNLRGAPSSQERLDVLERLAAPGRAAANIPAPLRQRAIAIASADPTPALRARAVQLAEPPAAEVVPFCRAALADDDAFVRRCAVARTVALLRTEAVPLLIERLAHETDEMTFPTIDAALCTLVPGQPPLPPVGWTPADRDAAIARWRRVAEAR